MYNIWHPNRLFPKTLLIHRILNVRQALNAKFFIKVRIILYRSPNCSFGFLSFLDD